MKTNTLRIIAFCIDMVVIGFLLTPFVEIPLGRFILEGHSVVVKFNYTLVIFLCYYLCFDQVNRDRTLGKLITGICVYDTHRQIELPLKKRLLRTLIKWVSFQVLPFAFLYYVLTETAFHDRIINNKTLKT